MAMISHDEVITNGKDLQYYKDICSELEAIFEMAFDQITVADGNGIF